MGKIYGNWIMSRQLNFIHKVVIAFGKNQTKDRLIIKGGIGRAVYNQPAISPVGPIYFRDKTQALSFRISHCQIKINADIFNKIDFASYDINNVNLKSSL